MDKLHYIQPPQGARTYLIAYLVGTWSVRRARWSVHRFCR